MYTYGQYMLLYTRNQYNIVNQLYSNKKNFQIEQHGNSEEGEFSVAVVWTNFMKEELVRHSLKAIVKGNKALRRGGRRG